MDLSCRLCGFKGTTFVCKDRRRPFYICDECGLVSVPENYWLSVNDEKKRYDLHNNSTNNYGYVKYLSQVADTAIELSNSRMKILDFGSGKEAVLCQMISAQGIDCRAYDPLYDHLNSINKQDRYGMIILCEVIEHLRNITDELSQIGNLICDNGIIVIRTQIYNDPKIFPNWWYAQDPTHINFFNNKSLNTLASILNRKIHATKYADIFFIK